MWGGFFYPLMFLFPVIAILVGVQNHLSATILIILIVSVMMLMAGTKLRYFLTFGTAGAATGLGALFLYAKITKKGLFRITRLITFLDPFADIQGAGWQVVQSLYAIGSGGLFGVGLGNSKQKYLYLPEPQNDLIFAVLAEELVFVGAIFVIMLFALFVWRGIVVAIKSDDMFGTLIAIGITTMIGLQALINIAVVTNTIPVTGMPLPFFSYGGSAMLADLMAVGVLLSISKNEKKAKA